MVLNCVFGTFLNARAVVNLKNREKIVPNSRIGLERTLEISDQTVFSQFVCYLMGGIHASLNYQSN